MAAGRSGSGAPGGANGAMHGEDATATPTRLVTRPAATGDVDPYDERYDFLDDRDSEFKWRPASGGEQASEADVRTAPAWVKRARAEKGRNTARRVMAWALTLAVIGAVATATVLFVSGRLAKRAPTTEPAPAAAKAPVAPAPAAPAAQAPATPPEPGPTTAPAQSAGPSASAPAANGASTPAESESANGADKPIVPPPGGEDGPPDPAQQEQPAK